MNVPMIKKVFITFITALAALTSNIAAAQQSNREFVYFENGQTTQGWRLTLGDKQKWNVRITDNTGKSLQQQVSIEPSDYKQQADAILLNWAAKGGDGAFAITGKPLDLSKVKGSEDQIALTFDINIVTRPRGDVNLSMYCDYPCRGQINLTPLLRKLESNTWHSIPVALTCFTQKGLKLDKITSPFAMQTGARFEVKLANIRLTRLPADYQGC